MKTILSLIICLIISGCSMELKGYAIIKAQEACKNKEGLYKVEVDTMLLPFKAHCKDGTTVQIETKY